LLYILLYSLHRYISCFNVFRYLTFRAALSALTSLLITILLGPFFIRQLKKFQVGQVVREDIPISHQQKAGTPTMGGVLILFGIVFSTLCWANLGNRFIWLSLFALLWLGGLGFLDDYLKLKTKNSRGLIVRYKLIGQILLGLIVALYLFFNPPQIASLWQHSVENSNYQIFLTDQYTTKLVFPFFKNFFLDLGWFYLIFIILVIVLSSNACNIADGLDGLAIGSIVFASICYGVFVYVAGNWKVSRYLNILFIEGSGELVILCASLVGAGLGFLWFNAYPASVFMGDTGALALGGVIGTMAVIIKKEWWLFLVGGIFVIEVGSVILQVAFYKLTGRRLFKMAPLHHHFELLGWPEPKVIVRFWIIAIILTIIALSTLKLT
jgi:phospho-N-acetylmuramoyl-pentapeptide-transferase